MNITKRDVLELRRRLTKKGCTFDRLSGCYINSGKEVILKFSESFSDLAEEEFFKYLEIAKKALSGSLGTNLLELEFERTEEAREHQQFLQAIKESKLQNPELLDRFYEQVMENYTCAGSYLILLFHDVYDVPVRTSDRMKLDESEEIYEYMICALCPVELSKAGLGYREAENRIGARERDWVVGLPEVCFVYPAFIDRGSDVNAVIYYTKGNSHPELIEGLLGCQACRTASEEKQIFETIVQDAFGGESEQADAAYLKIQRNLDGLVSIREESEEGASDRALTAEEVADVIADVDMPDEVRAAITEGCKQEFGAELPAASHLLDPKLAAEGARRAQTLALQDKITSLEQQLDEERGKGEAVHAGQIVLQVPQERRGAIRAEVVDGRRCLVIPLEDGETARVNGDEVTL